MAEPTDEIQELLNFLLPYAERMLNAHGEFYPYAAALDTDGELNAVVSSTAGQAYLAESYTGWPGRKHLSP